jgi:hypothetical protein
VEVFMKKEKDTKEPAVKKTYKKPRIVKHGNLSFVKIGLS